MNTLTTSEPTHDDAAFPADPPPAIGVQPTPTGVTLLLTKAGVSILLDELSVMDPDESPVCGELYTWLSSELNRLNTEDH